MAHNIEFTPPRQPQQIIWDKGALITWLVFGLLLASVDVIFLKTVYCVS